MVFGLNEAKKHLERSKAIVIAADYERGNLEVKKIEEIKANALDLGVPVIYAQTRKQLGKLLCSSVTIGIIGIVSVEGGYEKFKEILEARSVKARQWNSALQFVSLPPFVPSKLWLCCWYGWGGSISLHSDAKMMQQIDSKFGYSPLLAACWKGYPEIARFLIEHGADLNCKSFKRESCALLAAASSYKCFKTIVEAKKLKLASKNAIEESLTNEKLLDWIEQPDYGGSTPSAVIIKNAGPWESLKLLLTLGKSTDSQSLLILSGTKSNSPKSLEVYLQYYPLLLEALNSERETGLIVAVKASARIQVVCWKHAPLLHKEREKALQYTLKRDSSGKDALAYASHSSDMQIKGIIQQLIKALQR
jgi:ribosomal protein L7Ae-like RNA K-turn-binding protein